MESRDLSQTINQLVPNADADTITKQLTHYIDQLNQANTALRFTEVHDAYSQILGVELTLEDSQLLLSNVMNLGYGDTVARLLSLTSPLDLQIHIQDFSPLGDAETATNTFLDFLEENAHLDTAAFEQAIYEFTPSLFQANISTDDIDVMMYLASFVSDKYADIVSDIIGQPMTPPTLEEELTNYVATDQIDEAITIVKNYIDDKLATNTPMRVPHVYGDFLSLLVPSITHEAAKRILMILSFDEAYAELFEKLLNLDDDDLTEFIKVLVEPADVATTQTALLSYITNHKNDDPTGFRDNVYTDIKEIFNNNITDDDVDALLHYSFFIAPEYSEILDTLLSMPSM